MTRSTRQNLSFSKEVTKIKQELVDDLQAQREEMVRWLLRFLQVATVNPPGKEYVTFTRLCKELFEQLEIPYEVHEVPEKFIKENAPYADGEKRLIVLSRIGIAGKRETELHFNGHYDVVPAGDNWRFDPFAPKIKDGMVYGRGAADMKGALVAMAFAMAALKRVEHCLPGKVSLSFVPDEEMGGKTGTGYLVQSKLVCPSFCVIGEPTGLQNIWIAHKGRIEGQIIISGVQAHGSIPWKGTNAFVRASKLITWLDKHYGELLKSRTTQYAADPEVKNPSILWGGSAYGGSKATIVPSKFVVSFDRRVLPEEDSEKILNELQTTVLRGATEVGIPPEDIFVEGRIVRYPCIGGIRKEEMAAFQDVAQFMGRGEPRFILGPGGTDLSHMVSNGIRGVVVGPGQWEQAHTEDEHIRLAEVWDASKFYALFAINYLFMNKMV